MGGRDLQFLFVHQNFPGQYSHIVRKLVADGKHEVTFISNPNHNRISGVRRIDYEPIRSSTPGVHYVASEFEAATIRAHSVANIAKQLASIGYRPDVMLGHNGWGEILNLKDVWPATPLVPYFEFYYQDYGLDVDFDPEFPVSDVQRPAIRAKNAVNLLGLTLADAGQTPTRFQHTTYPVWSRDLIKIVPEGVDLNLCRPEMDTYFGLLEERRKWWRHPQDNFQQSRLLVTYAARNLEPYRGFHIFMRALPTLLAARSDVDVIIAGGDDVSYGTRPSGGGSWRDRLLNEVGDQLPANRVFFVGKQSYEQHLAMLKTSSVHVYLTYPFVASWSLREALACGCTIIASDTAPVREFIQHNETGRLVPFHEPVTLAQNVLELLDLPRFRERLGSAARRFAEMHLCMNWHYVAFDKLVTRLLGN